MYHVLVTCNMAARDVWHVPEADYISLKQSVYVNIDTCNNGGWHVGVGLNQTEAAMYVNTAMCKDGGLNQKH